MIIDRSAALKTGPRRDLHFLDAETKSFQPLFRAASTAPMKETHDGKVSRTSVPRESVLDVDTRQTSRNMHQLRGESSMLNHSHPVPGCINRVYGRSIRRTQRVGRNPFHVVVSLLLLVRSSLSGAELYRASRLDRIGLGNVSRVNRGACNQVGNHVSDGSVTTVTSARSSQTIRTPENR